MKARPRNYVMPRSSKPLVVKEATSSNVDMVAIGDATLGLGDSVEGMRRLPDQSFDLAIADPPYGAFSNGRWQLPQNNKLPGFGGAWTLAAHSWDKLVGVPGFAFALNWLGELQRVVKPTGSIWVHCTYHNSGIVNVACQCLGLEIINEIVWFKRNAFPNLAARRLTASHETILWVHTGGKKRRYLFNYRDVKAAGFSEDRLKEAGKQLRTVWDIPNNKEREELKYGQHPTQKPWRLTERILLVSGIRSGKILIPFMGSGSEMTVALRWGMKPTGFEINKQFFTIARKRVENEIAKLDTNPSLPLTEVLHA